MVSKRAALRPSVYGECTECYSISMVLKYAPPVASYEQVKMLFQQFGRFRTPAWSESVNLSILSVQGQTTHEINVPLFLRQMYAHRLFLGDLDLLPAGASHRRGH